MGPLKLAKNLDDNFLVLNGDVLTDIDFNHLLNKHKREVKYLQLQLISGLRKLIMGFKNRLK